MSPQPKPTTLTEEQTQALVAFADEGDRKDGTTAWGKYFDAAMKAAREVRDSTPPTSTAVDFGVFACYPCDIQQFRVELKEAHTKMERVQTTNGHLQGIGTRCEERTQTALAKVERLESALRSAGFTIAEPWTQFDVVKAYGIISSALGERESLPSAEGKPTPRELVDQIREAAAQMAERLSAVRNLGTLHDEGYRHACKDVAFFLRTQIKDPNPGEKT